MDTRLPKLDLILDTITDGVLVVDSQGVVLYANQAAEILLARSPLVGQSLAIPVNPDNNSPQDINLIRPNGLAWAEMRSAPLEWDGQPGYVIALRDITERKQAEMSLRKADQHKNEFLAMLGHELRNPLAPIRNAVAVMKKVPPASSKHHWAQQLIERQVSHLVRLVDDLLDVSRIIQGKIVLRKEAIDLAAVLHQAIEISHPLIQSRHHKLHVSLPDQPLRLDGDGLRLAQVIGNLLNNAAKYTPEGGQIWLTMTREQDEAVITVRDTGEGIPQPLLDQIFDFFVQAERSLDRSQGGLGLGLTIAKRLVELHGGRIEAYSQGVGQGSEFRVWLPILCPNAHGNAG